MAIGLILNDMNFREAHIMKKSRTVLIAMASLAISPMAIAEIYKCDGPDGPIYSDRECGPNAANVEIAETSGVSGVSDETKAELAQKKLEREEDKGNTSSPSANANYQYNNTGTEAAGRWDRRPYRKPVDRPSTLPVGQRPVKGASVKRR